MLDSRKNEEWSSENAGISGLSPDKMRAWDPKRASNEKKVLLRIVLLCLLVGVIGVTLFQYYSVTKQAVHLSQGSKTVAEGFSPVFVREASGIAAIISKTDTIQGYRVKDGKLLWQSEKYGQAVNGPKVGQGIVSYTTNTMTLIGLRISDGRLMWRKTPEHYKYSTMLDEGVLLLGDEKFIEGIQATTGKVLWQYTTANTMLWYPRVSDGLLFLSQDQYTLDVIRMSDGSLVWHYIGKGF